MKILGLLICPEQSSAPLRQCVICCWRALFTSLTFNGLLVLSEGSGFILLYIYAQQKDHPEDNGGTEGLLMGLVTQQWLKSLWVLKVSHCLASKFPCSLDEDRQLFMATAW